MKKIYFVGTCLMLIFACSKEQTSETDIDNPLPDGTASLKACFSVSRDTISVSQNIEISSCSTGSTSFTYNLNGTIRTEENPTFTIDEGGDHTISLTVTDEKQNTDTFTYMVYVKSAESHYIFPELADGSAAAPLETGLHPLTGNLYSINLITEGSTSQFYYSEIDAGYAETSTYIADKLFDSNSAFINFFPSGNLNFHFSRTSNALYGTQEVTYNNNWGLVSGLESATKHNYGFIADGSFYLYYGTKKEGDRYTTAIERRNSSGDAFEEFVNPIGAANSFIGDFIETANGYIAFGGTFTRNMAMPFITDYKPMLVFFDTALNVTSHRILEESVLDTKITSSNDLNGSYHLEKLANGNLVCYGNGELMVTDAMGSVIHAQYFEETSNNQALLALENSFIVSSNNFLRKFDANGNQLKRLKYNGLQVPKILERGGDLVFVGAYDEEGENVLFYGSTTKALELIDLNQ